eukprot:Partr_v1_DN23402_c0_g1_i1_m52380 putative Required for the retention of luminal endoplasmic reticulum proteins. Determines the specificity of the luminal ER protein retention system. Also required for normal vesicular traffic through the Golgi (By similarity)
MNIFRISADLMHLVSFIILLLKIRKSRSCAGISFKTQSLYLLVFIMRYLDLFTRFYSVYNSLMKIIFIAATAYIVYMMKGAYKASYDPQLDTFRVEYLIAGSALLSIIFHYNWHPLELLWTCSIFLESVSILPQLFMMSRTGEAETITTHYLFALGAYRALYLLNWIYRAATETGYSDWIAWTGGFVQTALYADFFYIYFTRVLKGKKFQLPA